MDNYNNVPSKGVIADMTHAINQNFALTKEMLERLALSKDKSRGLFQTAADLNIAYPSPEVGDWALVGDDTPFAVYVCETAGTWTDSGGEYDAGTIDLSGYAHQSDMSRVENTLYGSGGTTHDVYVNPNDVENPTSVSNNGYGGRAVYTDKFTEDKTFNRVIVKKVTLSEADTVEWRVYAHVPGETSNYEYPPQSNIAVNSPGFTLLASGTINIGTDGADITLDTGTVTCPANQQVIVYFLATSATIKLGKNGTNTEHLGVFLTTEQFANGWNGTWSVSSVGYGNCAPVLKWVATEGLVDRVGSAETEIIDHEERISELEESGGDVTREEFDALETVVMGDSSGEPSHDVYKNPNDADEPADYTNIKYAARGVYTTVFDEDKTFNRVIVKKVVAEANTVAEWRVYSRIPQSEALAENDYPPVSSKAIGASGNGTFTLLASGTVNIGTNPSDIILNTGVVTCPEGQQVLAYLMTDGTKIKLGRNGTTTEHSGIYMTSTNFPNGWSGAWNLGAASSGYGSCAPVLRWEREEGLVNEVADHETRITTLENGGGGSAVSDMKIMLPDKIYVMVGGEINLWNDGIAIPIDSGLKSPTNYTVSWEPAVGSVVRKNARGICIRPTTAGAFNLGVYLYTNEGGLLDNKTVQIVAVAKNALTSTKNVGILGSSSTDDWVAKMANILNSSDRYTGTIPTFWGTQETSGIHHEGHGGWKWRNVWGSPTLGDVPNPLYSPLLQHASASYYRSQLGMGSTKFDLVIFCLGLNDFIEAINTTPKTVAEYRANSYFQQNVTAMKNTVASFLEDNPDCKIVLALPYICNNYATPNLSANDYVNYEFAKASYAMKLEYFNYIAELDNPNVVLSAGHQMIDRFYGYPFDEYKISDASYATYQSTFIRPNDTIHCGTVGAMQYAEGFTASIIAGLGTVSTSTTAVGYSNTDIVRSNVPPTEGGGGSATDSTARTMAQAAQTTADSALTKANAALAKPDGLVFGAYDITSSSAPTDAGTTTDTTGTIYYFGANDSFMSKVGNSYYSVFPGSTDYMSSGHPIEGVSYWLNNKQYQYIGGKLRPLTFVMCTESAYTARTDKNVIAIIIEQQQS